MSGVSRWRDSGHLERAVETAGGQQAFDASVVAEVLNRFVAALGRTLKLIADFGDEQLSSCCCRSCAHDRIWTPACRRGSPRRCSTGRRG